MKKFYSKFLFLMLTASSLLIMNSCDKHDDYESEEKEKIKAYLDDHPDFNFTQTESGLYFLEVLAGTGLAPVTGDSCFVRYTGKFLDDSVFDTNMTAAKPYGFIVGDNINGFDEGLQMMKVGGKAKFLIPSKLAYGSYGQYPYISGYTPLLFDVEIVKVVKPAAR